MGGGTRSVGAKIAFSIWVVMFRVLLGAASVVDALSKWGLLHGTSSASSDLQPSPLGWLSPLVELVAGVFVLIGLRTRSAAGVLAAHLALGLLALQMHGGNVFAQYPIAALDAFLLAIVLIFGPNRFSFDFYRD